VSDGFIWGYSHLVIFASAAAVGAGLHAVIEQATQSHESIVTPWMLSIPVVLYFTSVAALRLWVTRSLLSRRTIVFVALATVVLLFPFVDAPLVVLALGAAILGGFPFPARESATKNEEIPGSLS
jgi:low temperature requirement protein LtrA